MIHLSFLYDREPLNFVVKGREIYYTQRKLAQGSWVRCIPPPENFMKIVALSRNRIPSMLINMFKFTDEEIKEYETYTLAGALAQNYTSIQWTTSGDGTFDNSTSSNPTYTPGANDIASQEVLLTITAVNTDCGNVSDQMTLAVNPSGVHENPAGFSITVSPNPNNGSFTVKVKGEKSEMIAIRIYNSLGKLVYEAENIIVDKEHQQILQLNLEKGVYLIRIEGGELLMNKKIIID